MHLDTLLAQFHGWTIKTDKTLHIKHLKPTGRSYTSKSKYLQGEALYKMRYGLPLTLLTALKSALNKKSGTYLINTITGYFKAKRNKHIAPMVSEKEGRFIRQLRWKGIEKAIGL